MDFISVNKQELRYYYLNQLLPSLSKVKRVGKNITCISPLRDDNNPDSFVIFSDGTFFDFATLESGDTIDLYSKLYGVPLSQLLTGITKEPQLNGIRGRQVVDGEREAAFEFKDIPAPSLKPDKSDFKHPKLGFPDHLYRYRAFSGKTLGWVCRFEKADGKICLPFTYDSEIKKWGFNANGFFGQKPIFQIDYLRLMDKTILIVEGEKTALAAQNLAWAKKLHEVIPGLPSDADVYVISWFGGTNSVQKVNWKFILSSQPREIYLCPDLDEPGVLAMMFLKKQLPQAKLIKLKSSIKGYDLADFDKELSNE